MTLQQALFSGVLQGATEFLPVSSSGHLVFLHHFFKIKEPQLIFDVFLHAGTLLAVLIFFRREIVALFLQKKTLGVLVLAGTVPIAGAGIVFSFWLEEKFSRLFTSAGFAASMLMVTGLWLFAGGYRSARNKRVSSLESGTLASRLGRVAAIGVAQALALFPGISRSGATISTALLVGVERKAAVEFSFLLMVPATIGALAISSFKLLSSGGSRISANPNPACFLVGMLSAALVGMLAIKLLVLAVNRQKFHLFGFYCIALGLAVLVII